MAELNSANAEDGDDSSKSLADVAVSEHRSLKSNGSVQDADAQQMVITSLRAQIQDLVSQVTQLNNKLVKSYDRVSDLEDELHVSAAHLRGSSIKISQLELERSQHLSALSTGLLVEKSHVTSELTRLMEKATDEAAQRGQAESARAAIEKELDDLSANLFNQANTMVAEARYARHISERKTEEAENALKGAEEAVSMMQHQVQVLREEKEIAEKKAHEIQVSAGKSQWIEQRDGTSITRSLRLLSSHSPYQEFLLFAAHLRSIHISTPQVPSMSTLLTLPFLQRLLTEDSEPTLRLDLAPALNWLTRRSVLAAIHNGQLVVEPISIGFLLNESNAGAVSGMNSGGNDIPCALCGTPIFSKDDISRNLQSNPLALARLNGGGNLWSATLFRKSTSNPYSGSNPPTPHRSLSADLPHVFIFRIASNPTSTPIPSLPIPVASTSPPMSNSPLNAQPSTIYPLCRGSWCLSRLRMTCSLWSFVRTGIVEKIWEEEIPILPPPKIPVQPETSKPPIPPRKRGLWGMASALGERAASWGEAAKKMAPSTQLEQQTPQETAGKSPTEKQPSHPETVLASTPVLPLPASNDLPVLPASSPVLPLPAPNGLSVPATPSPVLPPPASNHLPEPSSHLKSVEPHPPALPRRSVGRGMHNTTSSLTSDNSNLTAATNSPPRNDEIAPLASKELEKEHVMTSPQSKPEALPPSAPSPVPSPAPPATASITSQAAPPRIPPRASGHKRLSATLPERIALPDSRPGTPSHVGPPSRTTSPAPGTGAPPPIPRRAAGRGSRLTNPADSGSRPATPVHTAAAAGAEAPAPTMSIPAPVPEVEAKTEAKEIAATAESSNVTPTVQREDAPDTLKLPDTSGVAMRVDDSPSPSTEEWKSVNVTPVGVGSPQEEGAPRLETKSPEVSPSVSPSIASKGKSPEVQSSSNGSAIVSSSSQGELIPSDKSIFGSSKAASPFQSNSSIGLDAFSTNGDRSGEEKEGEHKEVYVGDATWEERTWKELVRLREDMFWARIGGLR